MDMEREERSGRQYQPLQAGLYKWAYQKGCLYMGDRKIAVRHPRLRAAEGEIPLQSYEALKKPGAFSQELLNKILLGVSTRKHRETLFASAVAVNYDIEEISISAMYLLFHTPPKTYDMISIYSFYWSTEIRLFQETHALFHPAQ